MFKIKTQRKSSQFSRPIVLLDICSISLIKKRDSILKGDNDKPIRHLAELEEMAKSTKYRFSLLLPIIEKATDYTNELNSEEMVERFKKDHDQIIDFIGAVNLVEPLEALDNLIPILMDEKTPKEERAELSIPASLALLDFFNKGFEDKNEVLRVTSTPPKHLRLNLAKQVAAEGERLGLTKGHPTITVCIASIYGCEEARGILKIKKDVTKFKPSNALGDIMSFYRVAYARHYINKVMPLSRVLFRTEDIHLQNMHSWFKLIVESSTAEMIKTTTNCAKFEKLLPALYKDNDCINIPEKRKIKTLLNLKEKKKKSKHDVL